MAIKEDPPAALRSTATVFLTVLFTFLGLALLLWVLSKTVQIPNPDPAFFDQFSFNRSFFNPLPFYRLGFQAVCLASPLLILLAIPGSAALSRRLPRAWLTAGAGRNFALLLSACIALVFAACLIRIVHFPHPPALYNSPRWLVHSVVKHLTWRELACVAAIDAGLAWFLIRARRPSAWSRRAAIGLLLAAWLFSSPVKFFSAGDVAETTGYIVHFNALSQAAVEAANGRHRLVDFTNQYGGYGEFLGPILKLLPRRVESLSLVFCLVHASTLLFLLLLIRLTIADDRLCVILGLGLLFCGNLYLFLFGGGDFIFQTYALRGFFPSLTLCAACLYFKQPTRLKYIGVSVLAACATIWNLESGVFLWGAWTVALGCTCLARKRVAAAAGHTALQGLGLAAMWGLFWIYLLAASGRWPDWHRLTSYQSVCYASGLGNLPLVVPDVWLLLVIVYITEMARCGLAAQRDAFDWRNSFSVMLVVFGMGLFAYFQNRPASSNLLFVSYPAVLVFGTMVDARLSRPHRPRNPWEWGYYAPGLALLLWWAVNFTLSLPVVARALEKEARVLRSPRTTPFQIDAAFIRSQTAPGEPCLILSRQSGLHHFLSATPAMLHLASSMEWVTEDQFTTLFSALRDRRVPKVFLDQDFFEMPWEKPGLLDRLRETLALSYRPAATSPSGRVTLYLPRQDGAP